MTSGRNIKVQEEKSIAIVSKSERLKPLSFGLFLIIVRANISVRTVGKPQSIDNCQIGDLLLTKATPSAIDSKLRMKGIATMRPIIKI